MHSGCGDGMEALQSSCSLVPSDAWLCGRKRLDVTNNGKIVTP